MEQVVYWFAWVLMMALFVAAILVRWQGDCDIRLATREAGRVRVDEGKERLSIRFSGEFANFGSQNGMILDVWTRTEHLGEVMETTAVSPRITSVGGKARADGYWEAMILEKKKRCPFEMELLFFGPSTTLAKLRQYDRIPLVLHYKTVGRNGIRVRLSELTVPLPTSPNRQQQGSKEAKRT